MSEKLTRREALLGASSTLLLPIACSTSKVEPGRYSAAVFQHGVASGDPDSRSVVLWTRVSQQDGTTEVDWQVAADPDFANVVRTGRTVTGPERDYTVKVVADGLEAGQGYYYRFNAGADLSPTGQTRTLPAGRLDELVLAVVSCSNYPFGYFNAYEAIAEDDSIEFVLHLGDYIYEYDIDGYGGEAGKRLGRMHEPQHEILTLEDYRTRHAQYKADPGSRAMHGRHPLIATWDDHESTNNPWMGGAQNHQDDEGDWLTRREVSLQAYFEWMPIRDPVDGTGRVDYWRSFQFGDLATLVTLETRHTGRSEQIDLQEHRERLQSPGDAARFYDEVVGAEDRTLLSSDMEAFVADALATSVSTNTVWRLIGNQTLIARIVAPLLNDPELDAYIDSMTADGRDLFERLAGFGTLGIPGNMDAWDGYPAARRRFYEIAKNVGARDLLVLTGDTHTFWANALFDDGGEPMGVELGTTAVTSPRGYGALGDDAAGRFDELVATHNQSVLWSDGSRRGYIHLALGREAATADFKVVTDIESRSYQVQTVRRATIVHRDGSLAYA
jgi:alkaline phosphatase D